MTSKQSTNFTGGPMTGQNFNKPKSQAQIGAHPPKREQLHGVNKSTHKSFKPLRHEGRLGAAISSDRKAYLSGGVGVNKSISFGGASSGGQYKSITSFNNVPRGGIPKSLLKSKSQTKNLQPLSNQNKSEPGLSQNLEINNKSPMVAVTENK